MPWVLLVIAGLLETCWAVGLKPTQGFTRLWPSLFVLVTMAGSILLLAQAMKSLPVGTAYAVWTGIGAVGAVTVGMIWLGEPVTWPRLACIGLILSGIIGLRLLGGTH